MSFSGRPGAAGGEVSAAKKRRRALLSSYYGITSAAAEEDAAAADPLDIDGVHFDADRYFRSLLRTMPAEKLVQKEAKLQAKIRKLDSEMQTMVYENYNKFLDATQTIEKMKTKVENMESEMSVLNTKIESITALSDRGQGAFEPNREQIRQLSGIHRLLRKLQLLFELPAKLRKCAERNALDLAVKYYVDHRTVLRSYDDFAAIRAECEAIMTTVETTLTAQVADPALSPHAAAEPLQLLLMLGHADAAALRDAFVARGRSHVAAILDSTLVPMTAAELDEVMEAIDADAPVVGGGADGGVATGTASTGGGVGAGGATVGGGESGDVASARGPIAASMALVVNAAFPEIEDFFKAFRSLFIAPSFTELTAETQDASVELLGSVGRAWIARVLQFVRDTPRSAGASSDPSDLIDGLNIVVRECNALDALAPSAGIAAMVGEAVAGAMRDQVDAVFSAVEDKARAHLAFLHDALAQADSADENGDGNDEAHTGGNPLIAAATATVTNLAGDIKSGINTLKPFADEGDVEFVAANAAAVAQAVQDAVRTYIQGMGGVALAVVDERARAAGTSSAGRRVLGTFTLALAHVFRELKEDPLRSVLRAAVNHFPVAAGASSSTLSRRRGRERSSSVVANEAQILAHVHTAFQALLDTFVASAGRDMSDVFRISVQAKNWLGLQREAREVRAIMDRVVDDLGRVSAAVQRVFPEDGPSPAVRALAEEADRPGSLFDGMPNFFSEKIQIFSSVEPKRFSITTGIIKIGLKTLVECVRLSTFSRQALHQLQLDVCFLRSALMPFADSATVIGRLLDEVMSSVESRCVDPSFMEASVVDAIVAHKIGSTASEPDADL